MEDDEVERYGVVRVADEFVVDLMSRACGLDYADATRIGIEHIEIEGVSVPVASRELLIQTKQTIRPHSHDVAPCWVRPGTRPHLKLGCGRSPRCVFAPLRFKNIALWNAAIEIWNRPRSGSVRPRVDIGAENEA